VRALAVRGKATPEKLPFSPILRESEQKSTKVSLDLWLRWSKRRAVERCTTLEGHALSASGAATWQPMMPSRVKQGGHGPGTHFDVADNNTTQRTRRT